MQEPAPEPEPLGAAALHREILVYAKGSQHIHRIYLNGHEFGQLRAYLRGVHDLDVWDMFMFARDSEWVELRGALCPEELGSLLGRDSHIILADAPHCQYMAYVREATKAP